MATTQTRYRRFLGLFVVLLCAAAAGAWGGDPRVKWVYPTRSNLYAPPLVADVHPAPGLETIISLSEERRLLCIDATGRLLWEFDGHWKKRLTSAASLSTTARPGKATLLYGGGDGVLCCIDAETGKELWRCEVGRVEWGAAIWADVNGDGRDEVVVGTEKEGIKALSPEGATLWTYTGAESPVSVQCPIAACEIDRDGKCEVFLVDRWGPQCLNGDGSLRWKTQTGDQFTSAPVIADADNDGAPELYCAASDDNAVISFDARSGELRWRIPTIGNTDVYPGSSIAVGDIDQDGVREIVAADMLGYVYCILPWGRCTWTYMTEKRTHAAATLGDVDGDGDIEVLVASGDHYLYCVDASGELEWRFKTGLRLIHPATIADNDLDGKTDILLCGSDRTLYSITLDGRYDSARIPWPSRRFNTAQTGASFGRYVNPTKDMVAEKRPLLAYGGFDQGGAVGKPEDYPKGSGLPAKLKNRPRGWQIQGRGAGEWGLDSEFKVAGASSLKVTPREGEFVIASEPIEVTRDLRSVTASVFLATKNPGHAVLLWRGLHGGLCMDSLSLSHRPVAPPDPNGGVIADQLGPPPPEAQSGEWVRYELRDRKPPKGARWLTFEFINEKGPAWWDDARIEGTFLREKELRAHVNQVGYETGAPKRFTAQSNHLDDNASFELVREDGTIAHSDALTPAGRISGAYGNDWGYYYWRGDFTGFNAPGRYRVRIAIGGRSDTSWPFEIAENLYWEKTARPAYRFFYYQRCGMAIPGFHGACHLDDAASPDGKRQYDLHGGWHDAGDYNTYHNAPYLFGLDRVYRAQQARFDRQDGDGNGLSDLFDEILWGGDQSRRMIAPDGSAYGAISSGYGFWAAPELETDNIPGTGDERRINGSETGNDSSMHAAAMAGIARFARDKAAYVEAAQRALDWTLSKGTRGMCQLSAALDLYAATHEEKYAALAKELFGPAALSPLAGQPPHAPEIAYLVDAIERYDNAFGENHRDAVKTILVEKAEAMLGPAENPFGLYTHGPREKPNFFGTPADSGGWHVGTSSFVLNAAASMALACRYQPDPRYLAFVYDQFNWTLGNNPYDISLMEGVGSANPPTYHHRYTFGGVPRGAVPGSIVNGITWQAPGDDRPYFDMRGVDIPAYESNEVWLPHNTAYLSALVNLQQAREGTADKR